jgi:DNA-binding SARP family transcriptional activator
MRLLAVRLRTAGLRRSTAQWAKHRATFAPVAIEYRILGAVEALVDGVPVPLGGPRQRGVLVSLLTRANTVVPAARVIDDLWEDDPPPSAANLVQGYVSHLRKGLGKSAIETRGAGYTMRLDADALDLSRFESLAEAGSQALAAGRAREAVDRFGEALGLWRGAALADLAGEAFHQPVATRLEELRVLALERRVEADLGCARHAEALADARALVDEHPLRERPRWLLMLALYRSGRQAEALEAYRDARSRFVGDLGIEPGPMLQELERAILRHDPALAGSAAEPLPAPAAVRSLIAAPLTDDALHGLVDVARPLAAEPGRELVVVGTIRDRRDLGPFTARLHAQREELLDQGVVARVACFTSMTPGADIARLASDYESDLLLVDAPTGLLEDARLLTILAQTPCDVAVVVARAPRAGCVLVPFTGADHDWSAVEIGAWLARNAGRSLRLAGASTGASARDASRLLANASIAVQRALNIPAESVLVDPEPEALLAAAVDAGVVICGLSDRWRRDGLGPSRTALATGSDATVVLVRRGTRPGGLAPREAHTRFTWTVAG